MASHHTRRARRGKKGTRKGRGRRRQLDQLRRARGREKLVHGEAALVREQVVMSVLSAPCGERTTAATSCSAGRSATRQPESSTS